MPMTQEEVFNKVREVLTGALAVDEEEVTPQAKLSEDLVLNPSIIWTSLSSWKKPLESKFPRAN